MIDTNVLSGAQLSTPPNQQQILIEVSAIAFAMQVINSGLGRLNQVLGPSGPPIDPQARTLILAQLGSIQTSASSIRDAAGTTTSILSGGINTGGG